MRIVLQRVRRASVEVNGTITGACELGVMLLVGFGEGDDESKLRGLAEKIANMRIFPDEQGRFHHSLLEVGGGVLAVPQFTLFADTSKGRRPDFFAALKPELSQPLFDAFQAALRRAGIEHVEAGIFGAHMLVALENDGPVTILLEA